jgi:inhibitor of KinA sporulation pathway (predicted exonuclease)
MTDSHLAAILRTLSKKEERELRKWLRSPVHNQREDVVQLFEYLMAGAHLQEEKFLKKERVFAKLFSDEPYEDAKIRQVMHFLLRCVEEFLIYQEQQSDEVRARMALASVFRQRKLDRAFQKTVKSVEGLQEKAPFRNEQFLRNEYLLQIERYLFFEGKKRTAEMNLQEVSDALDTTYIADKLRQSCLMLAHQAVYKAKYNVGFLNEVLDFVEKGDFLRHPAIAIYYYGYKAISDKSGQEHFRNLRQEIQKHKDFFPHSELRDIYLMAINYCVARINAGDENMRAELFDLYRNGIESMTLIENNELSRFTFRNIINLGTALKEFAWINQFIENYQQYLDPKYRETFVKFSKAKLYFTQRQYDEAMKLIAQSDFDDILINLSAKTMLLQIYYELDEYDALESLLESLQIYLRRKEVIGYHKANYQNIVRLARKLVRVNPYDKKQVESLQQNVEETKPLTEKQWFLEQLVKL